MKHQKNQIGAVNVLLILVIILGLALIGSGVFGVRSYAQYQDYKNNTDQKIATAVADARVAQQAELAKEFAEREKEPYEKFTSPEQIGSISFQYPKTWSVYVDEDGSSNQYEAYFHPNVIPPINSDNPDALRLSVSNRSYDRVLSSYESRIDKGELRATPIDLKSGKGTRIDGKFSDVFDGSMIVFPLRDKTVELYTESTAFRNDFNNIIIPSLTFIP